ncbi:MAG: FAD-dependent oxidoreductase [Actinobacteria bacterium]|nr:FAD-dependent oxidoreductase [Actinomycetota bacterium]
MENPTILQQKPKTWQFSLRNIGDLKGLAERLGVCIPISEDVSVLSQPVEVGTLIAPNSLAIHPMEGCDGDAQGRPGKLTRRRYERFAAGGAGLIWAEAIAVVPEGRANPRQLWLNEKSFESMAAMVTQMRTIGAESHSRSHRPIIVAQLTHSGRYSKPTGKPHPLIPQRDPYRDAKMDLPANWPVLTDEYLDKLQDFYVAAAKRAFAAGFDAIDIKACHGYLINEILACRSRAGKYGGAFENRVRFLLKVIDRIREEVGPEKLITSRLGIYDAIEYPFGWGVDKKDHTKPDLSEPRKLIELLARRGVKMLNISVANPYYNPHYGRPFNQPVAGGYEEPEHPLVGVARLIKLSGEVQRSFPDMAIVGTGYSWLRTLMPYVGAGAKKEGLTTFVGAGRMALAYPDFAADILQKGRLDQNKVCISCSGCTQIMRDGGRAGCVIQDNKVYGPIFKRGRMGHRENLVRLAQNCRQCQEATCTQACPAGVDIPNFINLFLEGKDRQAYEVIRKANLLAETCAELCPVETQCQGNCLERFIGDEALPIADIQRYLSSQANQKGWSKIRVPQKASGQRIAVIGAGPAGLACAVELLELGHSVTIFDKGEQLGGMIESAIPVDRVGNSLDNEITAMFADLASERFIFKGGCELNGNFNLDSIIKVGFEAVFIGLGLPKVLSSGSAKLKGLYDALEFLALAKRDASLELTGKQVAVIGGGNTAMDAAVTAKQLGAEDAYVIYRRSFAEMPAWPTERDKALNEGVHFLILTQQLDYRSDNGKLSGLKLCPTKLGEPDESGRRRPIPIESARYELSMDVVVEAIGQQAEDNLADILTGVELENGLIKTQSGSSQTSREKVFAGGDLVHGAATVVAAVADGMKAADEINEFLKK